MKKTIFGLLAAILGGVLGAGAMFYYGLFNPAATPAAAPAGGAVKTAEAKDGKDAKPGKAPEGAPAESKSPDAKGPPAAGGAPAGKGGPGGPGGPTAVEIGKVGTLPLPKAVTAVGSLRSDESVVLRSEVAGRITGLFFKEGQRVVKGQKLIELDASLTKAELEQARANQSLAKAKFDRAIELQAKGFVSGQAKDEAENALKVAEAGTAVVQARLNRLTINAPMTGVAGLRVASLGDYLKDGQDIVNIEKTDALKVDFKIPEVFVSAVKQNQAISVALDAMPGKEYKGTVYAINPQLDTNGRAVVIRALLKNTDGKLNPGMFARVRLLLDANADALVIPEQALVPQGEDVYVFKVVDGRVNRIKVEIGQRKEGKVEIVNGLALNDSIVITGWQKVRDGGAVRPAAPIGGGEKGGGAPKGEGKGDAPKGDAPKGDAPKGEGPKAEPAAVKVAS
jgi:membrane fusion protein, multidrug efflux system